MNRILSTGLAGLILALGATSADAAQVTVRVEGATGPLVAPVTVDPATVGTLVRDNANCAGTNSAAGALELATAADWGGRNTSFGVGVTRIKAEDYPTSLQSGGTDDAYWALFVNDEATGFGPCQANTVGAGDEVVFAAACLNATTNCFSGGALGTRAPTSARPGEAFDVTVTATDTTYPPPNFDPVVTTGPVAGARVAGGGATATTGADGVARVTLSQRGAVQLRVTRQQQVPDAVSLCVTDGADGFCGTRAPDGTTLPPEIGGAPVVPIGPAASAAPDTAAPGAKVTGIEEGQRFTRKGAPRRLTADVADPSGVLQVKLALTRQVGRRCFAFSGSKERFVRVKCGKRWRFKVDGTGDVDYLLPSRLGKGRYVFDVLAADKAYNRDELARGRNRVVFTVR